ncbi:hypothetical protein [Microbulbifer spongiae]|uniref:Uncharacterized protein n=1 Tax=Microbulbifer spongiae TaxID=2944933 RepID=A0ABY9EGQ2_9GAMM|nr:hypothetical protein [Microbulbifer sp. MI-G]WKD50884.1 hypothetical protein M8T91_05515 [Microbulbifer sp. MI-G]
MKNYIILITLFSCLSVNASVVTTNTGTIERMFTYDSLGSSTGTEGTDIAVWMQTGIAGCDDGVWLSPSSPGYNTITSFLLTAYASKQNVQFQIYDDKLWSGTSNSKLCQINAIRLR